MLPALIENLASQFYGIEAFAKTLPGEVDLNFKLTTALGKKYVLKVAAKQRSEEELAFQIALLLHLNKAHLTFEAPTVISTRSGTNQLTTTIDESPRHIHLLSWVKGSPLRTVKHRNTKLLHEWGAVCGQLSNALQSFDHPFAHRKYRWDPQHTMDANVHLHLLNNPEDQATAKHFFDLFEKNAQPHLASLRHSVNYNDAHEDNLLVSKNSLSYQISGLVDVGDAVFSPTISELAIACAYAGMDCEDPIAAMCSVAKGYHEHFTLQEAELKVLLPLIIGRLLITVTSAAEARRSDPDNSYRSVSEVQAWQVLRKLKNVHPNFAHYAFRTAIGLEGCPVRPLFNQWISQGPKISTVVSRQDKSFAQLDFSVESKTLGNYSNYTQLASFEARVAAMLSLQNAHIGYGGYLETRPFYTTSLFQETGNNGPRWRTVHLGLDFWEHANAEVFSPLKGKVHSFANNNTPGNYGATLILEHEVSAGNQPFTFYTLYGHLSAASIADKTVGQTVEQGQKIATTGSPNENGGWPRHLHFQVMLDLFGELGDFPGVCFPEETTIWSSICPDPALLSGLKSVSQATNTTSDLVHTTKATQLLQRRRKVLGRSLSLSYTTPLHMVRGQGVYLLDSTGRRYLDTVNNVAHVGHEHPQVVKAIQEQAALLNTNTRYLNEELIAFAEELCSTLPAALSVVHLVNSGSEANELALRMARAATGQKDMIAVEVGYHGNTNAVIDISSYKFDGKGGEGSPPTTHIVPIPDVYRGLHKDPSTAGKDYADYLNDIIDEVKNQGRGIAGFICESILSCGGQVVLPEGYLKEAFAKTRSAGGVCISDEVQVGLGRVGTHFWGFELQDVVPDIVVIGKPIGNGHPLGVVVCTEAIATAFANTGMEYFNTFGGNPVSAAAGRAVLQTVFEEGLQNNALNTGQFLKDGLLELKSRYPIIGDVRGHGLFLGFELVRNHDALEPADLESSYLVNRMRERGVLMSIDGPHHNVIKIKPPLVFGRDEAGFLLTQLDSILGEI